MNCDDSCVVIVKILHYCKLHIDLSHDSYITSPYSTCK